MFLYVYKLLQKRAVEGSSTESETGVLGCETIFLLMKDCGNRK